MPTASAQDVAAMDAAIREARRQYAEAKPKVMDNTSGFWNAEEKGAIRKAFLDMGVLLERWASTLRAQAVAGASSVAGFLEFGEKWLASAVKDISGEAYDRGLFAAVKYTATETARQVNPFNWPPHVQLAVAAGVVLAAVVAVAVLARRGGSA